MRMSTSVPNQLRLVNTQHSVLHTDHTQTEGNQFSDAIACDDPRWLFATRVQMVFSCSNRIQSLGQYNDLLETAIGMGFSDMHARAMVGIVEEAQLRGGLDPVAMNELMDIPTPATDHNLSNRGRWICFGVLFTWSFAIAGLMQLV